VAVAHQRTPHLHDACTMHMSAETCAGAHVAVSPGRHVIAHEEHGPTAGALHDAPVSTLGFFSDFFRE
jgi:hypothetical protein